MRQLLTAAGQLLIAGLGAVQLIDGLHKVLGPWTWPRVGAGARLRLKAAICWQLADQLIHMQPVVRPGQGGPVLSEAVHDGKQFVL